MCLKEATSDHILQSRLWESSISIAYAVSVDADAGFALGNDTEDEQSFVGNLVHQVTKQKDMQGSV